MQVGRTFIGLDIFKSWNLSSHGEICNTDWACVKTLHLKGILKWNAEDKKKNSFRTLETISLVLEKKWDCRMVFHLKNLSFWLGEVFKKFGEQWANIEAKS